MSNDVATEVEEELVEALEKKEAKRVRSGLSLKDLKKDGQVLKERECKCEYEGGPSWQIFRVIFR